MKSANIVLDENWRAKITDFGLSRISPKNEQHTVIVTDPVGTYGYVDPLYAMSGIMSKESDIYSFGVILFELLCGRLVIQEEGQRFLVPLARRHYEEGKLKEIIDPILRKQMNVESLNVFSAIAYQCVKGNPEERPNISSVAEKLEQVLGLQQEFERALALQKVADYLREKQEDDDDSKVKNMEHMKIPLEDIKLATHDFHDDFKIGIGGYGKVYKADLFHFDLKKYTREKRRYQRVSMEELLGYPRKRSTVAIKWLDSRCGQGTAEFLQEISVLPYFTHKNLVTLVGFCDEDTERILVYESGANLRGARGGTRHP